jgi:NADH-ubiquinone oxidoreductase chain 1
MTEHAAVIFVFFFLAEYGSILLMCILTSIFFLGGYLKSSSLIYILDYQNYSFLSSTNLLNIFPYILSILSEYLNILNQFSILNSIFHSLILGLKTSIMVFIFIWVRASFPRIRFDQLIAFCWTILLPILLAFIILVPCILFQFNAFIININLL